MNWLIAIVGALLRYIIPAMAQARDESAERKKQAIEIEDDPNYRRWADGDVL